MKAIILAAGKGTRLHPHTQHTPKPLLLINGVPILVHILNSLPNQVDEIILIVGYKNEMIKDYFGNEYNGRKISYIEQKEQLGTGHAAILAKDILQPGEQFLFMYADDLHSKKSIEKLFRYPSGMLVKEVSDPRPFGVVLVDKENRIIEIEEKPKEPKSNLVNIGVYLLNTEIFNYPPKISDSGEYYLTDMVTDFAKENPLYAITTSFWHPIGYPDDLEKAGKLLLDNPDILE